MYAVNTTCFPPVFHPMYADDTTCLPSGFDFMYADDTTLFCNLDTITPEENRHVIRSNEIEY